MEHDVLIYTLLYKQKQYQWDKNTPKISCGQEFISKRDILVIKTRYKNPHTILRIIE